ncbi:MAG TPA: hypothetical protein DDW36_02135 [Candidatus Magasanikbacteria bacterium]|nr:hypothetical protein [Candidatus Magasanikbacteria bacterium]
MNRTLIQIRFPFVEGDGGGGGGNKNQEIGVKFDGFFQNFFYTLIQRKKKDAVSLEMSCILGVINFFIVVPPDIAQTVKSLVFSVFPESNVDFYKEFPYLDKVANQGVAFDIKPIGSEAYTLRTYPSHKQIDPLTGFFNILSALSSDDAVFYQIVIRALDESVEGAGGGGFYSYSEKESLVEQLKPKFHVNMRLLFFTNNAQQVDEYLPSFENVFSVFSTERNRINVELSKDIQGVVGDFFNRALKTPSIMNTEELASLFHIPSPDSKVRGINWLYSRRAEPPLGLPNPKNTTREQLSLFAETNFHGEMMHFGFKAPDRRRHLYILGKSGSGKSKLLESLILEDIDSNRGVGVLDPHGDLVEEIIERVPERRWKDVVYFNSSDLNYPVAFNPIMSVSAEFKQHVAQGMIEIFKKSFGADWSPKIEHVFRFTILALMDYEKATIMGMQVMLTDRNYRQMIISYIQDDVVKRFWANEFSSWSEKFDNEAIVPLVNKLGQFLSIGMVRNVIAQPKNLIDFDDIMNNQKIFLCEISKGKLGEENSALMGAMMITKIQQQGMARAYLSEEKRKDFFLYVDEFQNFATESFETLLSEARKYRLCITVSHQYLGQLSKALKDTIFGNTGSLITFRTGAEDAEYIQGELKPRFNSNDIMNLGVREIYVKMSIDGATAPAFSAYTSTVRGVIDTGIKQRIIDFCRQTYAQPIDVVQKEIAEMYYGEGASSEAGAAATAAALEADFDTPVV